MMGCATKLHDRSRKACRERPCLWTALVIALVACGAAVGEAQDAPPPALPPRASPAALDHRVSVLTKALNLDARQQAELQRILAEQRQSVRKIWSDQALLPAERVPATRAVGDRTANQIRAILNDEQKKKYSPPKPPPAADTKPPDVSAWMDATRHK
jgi:hypothetical protein